MNHLLRHASRLWGLQTSFENANHQHKEVHEATLKALLGSLCGFAVNQDADLEKAIRLARLERVQRVIPLVVIANAAESFVLQVTLPHGDNIAALQVRISTSEGADPSVQVHQLGASVSERQITFENKLYLRRSYTVPLRLTSGYFEIELLSGQRSLGLATLLVRPHVAASVHRKQWGVFAPLYAVKSETNWGIGDFSDMAHLQEMLAKRGADFFGTLPLLSAVNEGDGADPSPYSPVSKLFWNEIYLDVGTLAKNSPQAVRAIEASTFQSELKRLREGDRVEHQRVFALKKQILKLLADEFFESRRNQASEFVAFEKRQPLLQDYAKFCARGDEGELRYHLYCQFQIDKTLRVLTQASGDSKIAGLYLDYPVGVSRSGFDAQAFSNSFFNDASAGAPPDLLFHGGQDWGFAPLHPIHVRKNGYAYLRECLRVNLEHASILRLDHIMAFYRLYAIPKGMKPTEGGYIRYRAREFFAVLAIEASRANARVVGEDLGTVPDEVRSMILENDCLRMWVYPFEVADAPTEAAKKIPQAALACINTHDLIPFAGYLQGRDTQIFEGLGFLQPLEAQAQSKDRAKTVANWKTDLHAKTPQAMFQASVRLLGASPAELVLLNIEDLWQETEPQNTPGTWREMPNWQRKLKFTLKQLEAERSPFEVLADLAKSRGQASKGHDQDVSQNPHTKTRNEPQRGE